MKIQSFNPMPLFVGLAFLAIRSCKKDSSDPAPLKYGLPFLFKFLFIILISWACQNSKEKGKCEGPLITKSDSLSCDTSRCKKLCIGPFKSKNDSLACITYCGKTGGNTNNNGIPSNDKGYFDLTIGGKTYHCLGDPDASPVNGYRYYSTLTFQNGSLMLSASSQLASSKTIYPMIFSFIISGVNSVGTFSANSFGGPPISNFQCTLNPTETDQCNPLTNCLMYTIMANQERKMVNSNCKTTDLPIAAQTITINKWGNPGQIVEGTVSGILYENLKSGVDCQTSTKLPYTGVFKIKRLI